MVARDRQRRSLLNTPLPRQRVVRTPSVLRVVDTDDPPPAPRLIREPSRPSTPPPFELHELPPDPSMVEFDLTDAELPELEMESFEAMEELEEVDVDELQSPAPTPPTRPKADPWGPPPVAHPAPAPHPESVAPSAPVGTSPALMELPLPPSPWMLLAQMAVAFLVSLVVTMVLVLVPWFAVVAPSIDSGRQARRQPAAPVVAPPSLPVVARPQPQVTVEITNEPPGADETGEPEASVDEDGAAATTDASATDAPSARRDATRSVQEPRAPARPRVAAAALRPKPATSVPMPTTPSRTRPAQKTPTEQEAPSSRTPASTTSEPTPAAVAPPAPAPDDVAPPQARALGGTLSGSAGSENITFKVRFVGAEKLVAQVTRGGTTRSASGRYTLDGNSATFILLEANRGATYSGKIAANGITGRYALPDGSDGRLKVRR